MGGVKKMKVSIVCASLSVLAAGVALVSSGWAGEPSKKGEPPKIAPATEEEKKAELDKETPEQKALRGELEALAKAGQRIAFNANGDGAGRIYIVKADGSELKCLTPDAAGGSYPHISPDGRKVAFVRKASKEELAKLPCDPKFPLSDAKRADAREGGTAVCLLDIESGKEEPAAAGTLAHWSADGKKLAYTVQYGQNRGEWRTAILEVEAKKERILASPPVSKVVFFPCFTPETCVDLNADGTDLAEPAKAGRLGVKPDGGCNLEVSKDGKWVCWVIDTYGEAGGWLYYGAFANGKASDCRKLELGWKDDSVNYYPDFSPDTRYLVYSHADQQKGAKSYHLLSHQDLYVTRFPDCKATVRVTWTNAACQHPHWWGPAGGK
jgi:Tol biopolymer transport system component